MTTHGWDMSHYDAPSIGNAVSEGIQFITHKAGGDANDAELDDWWAGVRGLRSRILLGAYWVLYPGNPVSSANKFLARLDSTCPSWRDTDFFLFADCEKWHNDSGTVPSIAEVNAFCDRLHASAPKLKPMGYLPQWVYGDKVSAFKYPIIQSDYVDGSGPFKKLYPGDGSSKWSIGGGKTATILQYSSKATIGGQTTCDANAFKGDLLALRKLVAPGFYTTAPKPPALPVHANGSRELSLKSPNMRGTDVKFVQATIGPNHAGSPDGIFGNGTRTGVVYFQNKHHLANDGIVGPNTWKALLKK